MKQKTQLSILRDLYRSIDERWRPEDIAKKIALLLDLSRLEQKTLKIATSASEDHFWSSMSSDFDRPRDMTRQLNVASQLFDVPKSFAPDDVPRIVEWIQGAEKTIGKQFAFNDFKHDRLSSSVRKAAGIEISRRQYNKRFRLAVRLEKKVRKLEREQFKRALTLASKNRLAGNIAWEDFAADLDSACFIAYYVARCNVRSLFTNASQIRPYDEICEMLMDRCRAADSQANWWAIAHVLPNSEILQRLDDERKGVLVGDFYSLMQKAGALLKELWDTNDISEDLVVQGGNDSTTWNVTAGAWNKLRDGWCSLMYDLGLVDVVEQLCPGKVLRLMAADVAMWHKSAGGDVHPDTMIWNRLPRPWEVLSGEVDCPKSFVEDVCRMHGVDPVKSGWSAPRPGRHIEQFTPTPELVHGVVVSSPVLAGVLRRAGVFSGKATSAHLPFATVDEIRSGHHLEQTIRRDRQSNSTDDSSTA